MTFWLRRVWGVNGIWRQTVMQNVFWWLWSGNLCCFYHLVIQSSEYWVFSPGVMLAGSRTTAALDSSVPKEDVCSRAPFLCEGFFSKRLTVGGKAAELSEACLVLYWWMSWHLVEWSLFVGWFHRYIFTEYNTRIKWILVRYKILFLIR